MKKSYLVKFIDKKGNTKTPLSGERGVLDGREIREALLFPQLL